MEVNCQFGQADVRDNASVSKGVCPVVVQESRAGAPAMSWHAATIHESTDGLLGSGHLPRSSRAGRPRRSITDSTASTTWPCSTGAMMSAGTEKTYTISGTNRTRVLPPRRCDGQHAEAQHGRERVNHLRLIAPVADAAGQGLGETQAAFRLAQQDEAAVRGDQAAVEGGAHPLALDAWQIEGERAIVGHGGRGVLVAREETRFGQRIPTRWQRLTLRPPPQNQTRQ